MGTVRIALLTLWLGSACVESNTVHCADGRTCPADSMCHAELGLCVTNEAIDACSGLADGDDCDLTADPEKCQFGVCVPAICGNGRVDPGEACDDSNTTTGDGCSFDCRSDEQCGTGTADLTLGEGCDDGNWLDHDGCSSTCEIETPRWIHRPVAPPGRFGAGIVYDQARDRILLIGGLYALPLDLGVGSTIRLDPWEWDGRWRETTEAVPPPRTNFAMAYDSTRKRAYLYGGHVFASTGGYVGDLWEHDGTSWKQVPFTGGPWPRLALIAMTYDSVRDLLIVVGGSEQTIESTKTWMWNGTAWSSIDNPVGLTPRYLPSIAFDPKRGKTVLLGGQAFDATTDDTFLDDVWELDAGGWVQRTSLSPRIGAAMAWNASCQCIVVFGGHTNTIASPSLSAQTATWNGQTWTVLSPPSAPTARSQAAFVHDGHGRSILVGGGTNLDWRGTYNVNDVISDTWIFDGVSWQQVLARAEHSVASDVEGNRVIAVNGRFVKDFTGAGPGPIQYDTRELVAGGWRTIESDVAVGPQTVSSAMVNDEARHEHVVFGGARPDDSYVGETWLFRDNVWSNPSTPTAPSSRVGVAMAYDVARQEAITFGGRDGLGMKLDDTWAWNGTAWSPKAPASKPSPRSHAAIAYDRVNQQVVLFGGSTATGVAGDTWQWDGSTWSQPPITGQPFAGTAVMSWNPARRRIVLVDAQLAVWEWTGTNWEGVAVARIDGKPQQSRAHSSRDGSGITLMEGFNDSGTSASWDLVWAANTDSELCFALTDTDGDGLQACADPDCWTSCSPACPPGTSCTALSCGDGMCSAAESCRTCPADCTSCGGLCGDGICDPNESCAGDC